MKIIKKTINVFIVIGIFLMMFAPANAQKFDINTPAGPRVHDPTMIKEGDIYYVFYTGKGIPFIYSKDKIHWTFGGRIFSKDALPKWHKQDIPQQDGDLWAPDISYVNGKYYLYYAVSAWMNFNSSIGLAENSTLDPRDPHYKWLDKGQVINVRNGGNGVNVIDPSLVADKYKWLIYGSFKAGLRMIRLDSLTGFRSAKDTTIYTITSGLGEGSCIIKSGKYYYLFTSRGRCCAGLRSTYQIVMGRSKNITGPYLNKKAESLLENKYSIFLAGDDWEPGRGGNSFFTEGDTTYVVYHAYSKALGGKSVLKIKPLFMDADGWPTLNNQATLFKRKIN